MDSRKIDRRVDEKVAADQMEGDVITELMHMIRSKLSHLHSDEARERVWRYIRDKFDAEIYPRQRVNYATVSVQPYKDDDEDRN